MRPSTHSGRMRGVTSTRASIMPRGVMMVAQSPCSRPTSRRQLGRDFAEQLRLQFGQMRQLARHAAGGVMLGEAIGRQHVGKALIAGACAYGLSGRSLRSAAGL